MSRKRALHMTREVLLWLLSLLLVFVFIKAGLAKFFDSSGWARAFNVWGYPAWFRIAVGIGEVGAALLLLYPRTASCGALIIIVVMLGGMATHVINHHSEQVTSELGQIIFATVVLIGRWSRLWRKSPQATAMETGAASG